MLLAAGDSVLLFVPLSHVFGLNCILNASLLMGLKIIIMSKFNPENFLILLQEYKVTEKSFALNKSAAYRGRTEHFRI